MDAVNPDNIIYTIAQALGANNYPAESAGYYHTIHKAIQVGLALDRDAHVPHEVIEAHINALDSGDIIKGQQAAQIHEALGGR